MGCSPLQRWCRCAQALLDIELPKTVKQVRRHLGMTGWYRKFIRGYAAIARPLTDLTKKENKKNVAEAMKTPACVKAFEDLRQAPQGPDVMLYHPDYSKRFTVDLDASCEAIGGVLLREVEPGMWKPVEFLSKKVSGGGEKGRVCADSPRGHATSRVCQ